MSQVAEEFEESEFEIQTTELGEQWRRHVVIAAQENPLFSRESGMRLDRAIRCRSGCRHSEREREREGYQTLFLSVGARSKCTKRQTGFVV